MDCEKLPQPPRLPRSVATPFLQRKASSVELGKLPQPTMSPASLMAAIHSGLPPIELVVRSRSDPWSQRNAWQFRLLLSGKPLQAPGSEAMLDWPTIWPPLLRDDADPKAPPNEPRSIIPFPSSQRNGSVVGKPVSGFAFALVAELPTTWPRSLIAPGPAQLPPNVPMSLI